MMDKQQYNTNQAISINPMMGLYGMGLLLLSILSCQQIEQATLFKRLSSTHTGIDFQNQIIENDTHNILNFTNLYTGSGVGIGDFNKDGKPDIFFGGNMESSRLYLNKGNLQFEDITLAAGVTTNRWITGVSVVDINSDGWQDIYLSVSGNASEEQRKNLLFINQKDNTFKEKATEYGLADAAQCTHASFFDYDKDGDLDVFLIVNPTDYKLFNVNTIRKKKVNGEAASTDKLYRNNGNNTFTDVSKEAGILIEGYSLSLNTSDLNNDGWTDIYITNDFLSNDIIYINNQDGTFTNQADQLLKHTSFASMGVDVADINNDALPDIYVLDMYPEDNYRQKMIMGSGNYDRFQYILKAGYEPQYSRNTLQLNNGNNSFSEIGQLANIHKTDWSWSALLADYDNDGWRDLFVTNGFRRDLGDLDYINYNNTNAFGSPESRKQEHLKSILNQPGAKLLNYAFQNKNGLQFEKKTQDWGFIDSTYSHGAAYADLDNDGDLDLVVNNVCQEALIYENQSNLDDNHFLKIQFPASQTTFFGTKLYLYTPDGVKYTEFTPYRGYQSTLDMEIHFGLGTTTSIDSLVVHYPNFTTQTILQPLIDTTLHVEINEKIRLKSKLDFATTLFAEDKDRIQFTHQEDLQVDFKTQALLPHQHSMSGPCLAVADINGDQLEDVFIGGSARFESQLLVQQKDGSFIKMPFDFDQEKEDTDALFFDVDQDGDQDLYVGSGGVVASQTNSIYQDRLYINDGTGQFTPVKEALPMMHTSTGTIAINDFDQDGDIDLFIGSRLVPKEYPTIPDSYLLVNENGKFQEQTPTSLKNIGMISSAIWSDYDADGDPDLIVVGEFMPITVFNNENGKLKDAPYQIPNSSGWWNSIVEGDFDQDGDLDYLAGNLGLNTNYRATSAEPVRLYANDFDKNGSIDPILCQYIEGEEYPVVSRDDLIRQIPPIKVRFTSYKSYANATFEDLFKRPEKRKMQVLEAQELQSCWIENENGNLVLHPLPVELQLAPIQDVEVGDFNQDGQLDALAIGNSYATEDIIGRYDAFTGALIQYDKDQKQFQTQRGHSIGCKAYKDARSISKINLSDGKTGVLIGNNQDELQFFTASEQTKKIVQK